MWPETIKLLQEKLRWKLYDIGLDKEFMNMSSKYKQHEEKYKSGLY